MNRHTLPILLFAWLLVTGPAASSAADDEASAPSFHLPVPAGWRTETVAFPLPFAPQLDYQGIAELRFAPGMFDAQKQDFWSYLFVWWLDGDSKIEAAALADDLEAYFRGLAQAVAEGNGFEPQNPVFAARFQEAAAKAGSNRVLRGEIETFDAFATRRSVHLEVRIEIMPCPDEKKMAVIFELSPQPAEHAVWQTLTTIRQGFRCHLPTVDGSAAGQ